MITFKANVRNASARTSDVITSRSVGIPVRLVLDREFDGLQKTVVFKAGKVSVDIVLVGDAEETLLPPDVLNVAGQRLHMGIYAADGQGNVVIPTVWASVATIQQGVVPSGVNPASEAPSWAAQIQTIANEAMEVANDVRIEWRSVFPAVPESDGEYLLKATVSDGQVVYSWVEQS